MTDLWPWMTLALMGVYHGVNPAMGWLFAVALGLQERSRTAVLRALVPIACGHAASITLMVIGVGVAQGLVGLQPLRLISAAALIGVGTYKLLKPNSHPRWVGMRVGFRDLSIWSFLMSTAHGAGLMLVPVLLHLPASSDVHTTHIGHTASNYLVPLTWSNSIAAVGTHTAAMFFVMGAIALIVFEFVGLALLRRVWFNLDLGWAGALIVAGIVTFAI